MRTATPDEQALWPSPNFDNPEKLHGPVIGITVATFTMAVVCESANSNVLAIFLSVEAVARMVGRRLLRQALRVDDYLMLAAMAVAIPMSIFPLLCLNLGLGLHIWDQKPEWHILYAKLGFASDILFPVACSLTKISQCISYLRLFPGRSNEIFCHIMILYITSYTVACVFISLLQCRPVHAHWHPSTGLECTNMHATFTAMAVLNSISDLLIYLRPAKSPLTVLMPVKQRWGLGLLLAVSLCPCIAGLLRLYYLEALYDSVDELWNASIIWALMMTEMNLGVVCGCLFGVQPVLARIFPRLFAKSYPSHQNPPPPITRQASGYHDSSNMYPLYDLSRDSQHRNTSEPDTFENLWTSEGMGSNFAGASSSGRQHGVRLTPGVITVDKEFTVKEEITPCQSPTSNFSGKTNFFPEKGSGYWTLDDVCLKDSDL